MARIFGGIPSAVDNAISGLPALIESNSAAIAAFGLPLRTDAAQSLTAAQIAQVGANLSETSLIGAAGYKKFADGLIVQWATVSANSSGVGSWAFPTTFPNACFGVLATATGISNDAVIQTNSAPSTSSVAFTVRNGSNGGLGNIAGFFIALGK